MTENDNTLDVLDCPTCEDFDEDCQTMSLNQVLNCMQGGFDIVNGQQYELTPCKGICVELQRRQSSAN